MGEILKGKTHIIERTYKVNGFVKNINDKVNIEVGAGNNQINPKDSEFITYSKIQNKTNDFTIKVRLSKNGKESKTIKLGPDERYDAISIFFTGLNASEYHAEAAAYIQSMLSGFYEIPCVNKEM